MTKSGKISVFISLSVLTAFSAGAWTIFGSQESALKDKLKSGDRYMERADAAYEAGNMERAGGFYEKAIGRFEYIAKINPDFMDGIAAARIEYCANQYTNAAIAFAEGQIAEADNEDQTEEGAVEPEENDDATDDTAAPVAADDTVPAATEDTGTADAAEDSAVQQPQEPSAPPQPEYDPRNFVNDFNEARTLIEDGNISEAAAVLIPLLKYDPSNRQVRMLVAVVRTRQGRYNEAIMALEDLRGRREDLPLLLILAGAYTGASRYHDALLALDSAIKLNPADPNAYMNLAWLTLVMPGNDPDTLKNAETYYRLAIKHGATRDRALEKRIGLVRW